MGEGASQFGRTVGAATLGYAAAAAITWLVFDPADLTGTTRLVAFGGCFAAASIVAYLSLTRLASTLRERGYPVSRGTDAAYALATAGLLFGVGAVVAYAPLNRALQGRSLVAATFVAGGLTIVIGAIVLEGDSVRDSLAG
ncbi:hypothetical protein B4589_005490 [Halolamina sp. CBA1230]|uniref:hypothetical protein n=1 Tax=Halolamina sp. CBA1230 TaxID=1853690 RepID=UPI0009A16F03|nr:hypothetical protein [Halolamina sp. CBA1230]QKY19858.1 hypothetical protein B4589_005490 [Halolamina sp. CBA1230]